MRRNLALELVRVTEAAALSAARTMGLGKVEDTHRAAIEAMKHLLESLSIEGVIVLGEGEPGEVERLARGTVIGKGEQQAELITLPIDSPASCSQGEGYALSVLAACQDGMFLKTPDIYFEKLVVGPKGKGVIDLNRTPIENLKRFAESSGSYIEDITVTILDRPRHTDLIRQIREAGARIRLIPGGDVSGALATCNPQSPTDVLMGVGRAREGLLAAAAVSAMGGDMQMRARPSNRVEQEALRQAGIADFNRVFKLDELVSGDISFAATGVTRSEFLEGVQFIPGGAISHSLVVRSVSGTVRRIVSEHHFDRKPIY
jgi:fructose-1,6-bisphosphatase II